MRVKKPIPADQDWLTAQAALEAARQLPAGVERFEALKQAGKLRYHADRKRKPDSGSCKSTVHPEDQS